MTSLCRRTLLAAACAAPLPLMSAVAAAASSAVRPGDLLQAVGSQDEAVLRVVDLAPDGAPTLAWPVDPVSLRARDAARFNQVLVARTRRGTAVAFTAVCTHAGCIVSDWIAALHLVQCPCHGSQYDLNADGAAVRGPAPLPLPRLQLAVHDGRLTVVGGFDAHIGGHTSRTD